MFQEGRTSFDFERCTELKTSSAWHFELSPSVHVITFPPDSLNVPITILYEVQLVQHFVHWNTWELSKLSTPFFALCSTWVQTKRGQGGSTNCDSQNAAALGTQKSYRRSPLLWFQRLQSVPPIHLPYSIGTARGTYNFPTIVWIFIQSVQYSFLYRR